MDIDARMNLLNMWPPQVVFICLIKSEDGAFAIRESEIAALKALTSQWAIWRAATDMISNTSCIKGIL